MAQDDKRQSCSPEQLQAYFDRIELPDRLRDCGPRLEQLTALQAHHLAHIPWENLTLTFPELRNPDDTPLVETFTLDRLMSKLVHRKMRQVFDPTADVVTVRHHSTLKSTRARMQGWILFRAESASTDRAGNTGI